MTMLSSVGEGCQAHSWELHLWSEKVLSGLPHKLCREGGTQGIWIPCVSREHVLYAYRALTMWGQLPGLF